MAVYKQQKSTYGCHKFTWKGEPVRKSTRQSDKRVAEQIEAAHKTAPAEGEVGIVDKQAVPTLKERRQLVAPAAVKRQLATLRRALWLAHEWKVINRLPKIRLLQGERTRKFVLSREQEPVYLKAAPQPLQDLAHLMLDTGLRDGEALPLKWPDIHMKPAPQVKFGYLQVRKGESRKGRRTVSLTLKIPEDFVVHSSTTISQRYGHPSPESVESAFEKLEESHQPARSKGPGIQSGIGSKKRRSAETL